MSDLTVLVAPEIWGAEPNLRQHRASSRSAAALVDVAETDGGLAVRVAGIVTLTNQGVVVP